MAKRKCVICGNWIENDDTNLTDYKGRKAHTPCFNNLLKVTHKEKQDKLKEKAKTTSSSKPKKELKEGLTEEEYQQKVDYYNYLRKLLGTNELEAKLYALTDNYIKKYRFTYLGMYRTLYYVFELNEHPIEGDCVGLIPYYYSKAQEHFKQVEKIEEFMKQITQGELTPKINTIAINPPRAKNRFSEMMNIDEIE